MRARGNLGGLVGRGSSRQPHLETLEICLGRNAAESACLLMRARGEWLRGCMGRVKRAVLENRLLFPPEKYEGDCKVS